MILGIMLLFLQISLYCVSITILTGAAYIPFSYAFLAGIGYIDSQYENQTGNL